MSRARGSMAPPPLPDGEAGVLAFAAVARRFCTLIGSPPPADLATRAVKLAEACAELYGAALPLLFLELPDELAAEQVPDDTIDVPIAVDWADLGTGPTYQLMVEPFGDQEPATGSLQDDLEEVLAELAAGLALLAESPDRWPAAALEWRMAFATGWGRHLASLLYAAHCAIDD
jgi:hypothetical protein